MDKKLQLYFFFFLLVFFSCTSNHPKKEGEKEAPVPVVENPKIKEPLKTGEVITSVAVGQDASQSYALYLPKNYSDSIKFPVMIFFDPHASGSYPVSKYKLLAEHFGYVLMGSNNSKNGLQFDQTNVIANALLNEAVSKYAGDQQRVAFAGFSGGAKVALVSAADHNGLLAVIYCGAAIPFDNIQQLPPALGYAGERDLNYTEVIASSAPLTEKKISHAVIEWKGKHEWPDSISFVDAFFWCSLNAMRNKTTAVDNDLINLYLQKKNNPASFHQPVLSLYNTYIQEIVFLRGLTDITSIEQKFSTLIKTDLFNKEIQRKQNVLQTERNLKQNYAQCFESKDLNWWKDEIARMRKVKTGDQGKMSERLLGYLSLASYSYSNNAIKQNNFSSAQQFLAIYKLSDPENSEQPFLTACMFARQGDQEKAIASLKEAIRMGVRDKTKIETEESFNSLHGNAEFNKLISEL